MISDHFSSEFLLHPVYTAQESMAHQKPMKTEKILLKVLVIFRQDFRCEFIEVQREVSVTFLFNEQQSSMRLVCKLCVLRLDFRGDG